MNFPQYCISKHSTLKDALEKITHGVERVCFVVDEQNTLLRVITDGDIRRSLLQGAKLTDTALFLHKKDPIVVKEGDSIDEARRFLSKNILCIPVVNENYQIIDVLRINDLETFSNIRSRRISVIGLGYVGLTLSVILAEKGFLVQGCDVSSSLLDSLKKKKAHFHEAGINTYLSKHIGKGLTLSKNLSDQPSDIYIVSVGTPINKEKLLPLTDRIINAVTMISSVLKPNDLVILRSTVPVGTTRKLVLPILEENSGLKAGNDFSLAYCPERTAEGKALIELKTNPQIIGGFNSKSTELASRLFGEITHTVIDSGSLEASEMCKLLDNTFRDVMFSYSNLMAPLAEHYGLNLCNLIDQVNLGYERNRIPKPSPGVGGACLSKDSYILASNFKENNLNYELLLKAREINETAPKQICDRTEKMLSKVGKNIKFSNIFVIGLAFKGEPETSDLRESTTIWFINELRKRGCKSMYCFDPVIKHRELSDLGLTFCNIKEGFQNADAVFFMNNHRSYKNLPINELIKTMNMPSILFDCWNIFDSEEIKTFNNIQYAGIGIG